MDGAESPRVAYLVLLLVALVGWFFAENRMSLGRVMRTAMVWGLIFLGVIAAYGLWGDIRDEVAPQQSVISSGTIAVPRGPDGHYRLTLMLNDVPVDFIVDTGATEIVLTKEDAARVGLDESDLSFTGVAVTANGSVRTARARIDEMSLGPITDADVPVAVNQGDLFSSLLGMTYLQRFDRIEIADGRLLLERE